MNRKHLVKLAFGSHLYGTADELSDIDSKIIYLPPIDGLLLGQAPKNSKLRDIGPNETMKPGEEEIELIPIQRFAIDFFEGQTYAYELAFSIRNRSGKYEFWPDEESRFRLFVGELVRNYMTRDMSKMVSYAISQAQIYGVKGERLQALENVLAFLKTLPTGTKLKEIETWPDGVLNQHVTFEQISGKNVDYTGVMALKVNNRFYQLNEKVKTVIDMLEERIESYGKRAQKARGEAVDWKALSHAIRIVYQANQLLSTRELHFPLDNATYLKAVKHGEVPFDEAVAKFELLNNNMERLLQVTTLPTRTEALRRDFQQWLIAWLKTFYNIKK